MATFSQGAIVSLGVTTTSVIAEVTSISGIQYTADTLDTTTHASTNRYKTFIQGMRDAGEITIEGYFTTTSGATAVAYFETTSLMTCTIDLPTSPSTTRFTATVFITGFSTEAPLDGIIPFTTTLKVTGKPSLGQV